MAQRATDDQPEALGPPSNTVPLLAAAVIARDKATGRVALLQRSQSAKSARGMGDLPVGKRGPGEPITGTAVREHAQVRWVDLVGWNRAGVPVLPAAREPAGHVV